MNLNLPNNCISAKNTRKAIADTIVTTRISATHFCSKGYVSSYMKTESHPLLQNISEVAKCHPLMRSILDASYNRYLLAAAKITKLGKSVLSSKLRLTNTTNLKPITSGPFDYEPYLPYPVKESYENIMGWKSQMHFVSPSMHDNLEDKQNLVSILTTKKPVVQILNWLSLISLYITEKNITLEQFQKNMILHMVMFAAATNAPYHMHILEKIILAFFDVNLTDRVKYI